MKTLITPLIILTLVVAASHFWFNTIDWTGKYADIDLKHYREMASAAPGILTSGEAPFIYRILPTWMAGVAGKGLEDELMGFKVVSAMAIFFACMALYWYLVGKGVREATALTLVSLAVISQHVLGSVVFNPFQTCDALAIALMVVMLICVERGHITGFIVASVAGALTREPCMLMLPVALTYVMWRARAQSVALSTHTRNRFLIVQWVAACIPAIVVAVAVRTFIHAVNTDWSLGAMLVENSYKFTDPETWVRLVLFAGAPISLIPIFFFRQTRDVLAGNAHLLVLLILVVASSFLGGDTERLVAPAMVVYYLIVARVLDARPSRIVNCLLIIAGLVSSMHPTYARYFPGSVYGLLGSNVIVAFYVASAISTVVILIAVAIRTKFRTEHR